MDAEHFIAAFTETLTYPEMPPINASTELGILKTWDSLGVLLTISFIETDYGVLVSGDELGACQTVGDVAKLVETKSP